ncbi:MAG: cytochrome c [Pseudomonadota bacterium]
MSGLKPWTYASAALALTFGLALALATIARGEAPVSDKPDPVRGQALAERLCANCHLVSDSQASANADVPSFKEIAGEPHQTQGAVMAHIVMPKHPMPVIPITKAELEHVSSYIMSLRDN